LDVVPGIPVKTKQSVRNTEKVSTAATPNMPAIPVAGVTVPPAHTKAPIKSDTGAHYVPSTDELTQQRADIMDMLM
jgi:hypothetical protein